MAYRRIFVAALSGAAALSLSLVDCPSASAQTTIGVNSGSHASGPSLSAVGLGLLGGGVLTSAPGFAVLAACKEGKPCHSDATEAIGWLLAAPGIPPILVGLFFVWLDKPHSRGGMYNAAPPPPSPIRIGMAPLPGSGGMVSVGYSF